MAVVEEGEGGKGGRWVDEEVFFFDLRHHSDLCRGLNFFRLLPL